MVAQSNLHHISKPNFHTLHREESCEEDEYLNPPGNGLLPLLDGGYHTPGAMKGNQHKSNSMVAFHYIGLNIIAPYMSKQGEVNLSGKGMCHF